MYDQGQLYNNNSDQLSCLSKQYSVKNGKNLPPSLSAIYTIKFRLRFFSSLWLNRVVVQEFCQVAQRAAVESSILALKFSVFLALVLHALLFRENMSECLGS